MIDVPTSPITGVPGWETENEQHALYSWAQRVPHDGVIVEIGAEYGMSASMFCLAAPSMAKIYSIDLFPRDVLRQHRENLLRAGFAGRSTQIMGDSYYVGVNWKGWFRDPQFKYPIDLLFIDGDHNYAGVVRDIDAWIPNTRVGCMAIFHDANPSTNQDPHYLHEDVNRAVDEWYAQVVGDERRAPYHQSWSEQEPVDTMRIFVRYK